MAKRNNSDISRQINKLRRNKRILWLAILLFVMVVLWILLSIFATTKTSSITTKQRELAKSFVPRLESKVFDEILQKRSFPSEELNSFPIYVFDETDFEGKQDLIDITNKQEEVLVVEETVENTVQTEASSAAIIEEATNSGSGI